MCARGAKNAAKEADVAHMPIVAAGALGASDFVSQWRQLLISMVQMVPLDRVLGLAEHRYQ